MLSIRRKSKSSSVAAAVFAESQSEGFTRGWEMADGGWAIKPTSPVCPPPSAIPVSSIHAESLRQSHQPLPSTARGQPGRVVRMGTRGARGGEVHGQADPAEHRLRRLPLVSRHGARVVRDRKSTRLNF